MSQRIFLFSHDPGGANTLVPLAGLLEQNGYETLWYGKGPALKKYNDAPIHYAQDLSQSLPVSTPQNIAELLQHIKPDAVITATSAVDPTEKYLWLACEQQNIPSLAVLDQWINYGIRFSPYTVEQLDEYKNDKRFPYLPSQICVMDEFARQEAIADGLPADRLVITGQPYFDTVRKNAANITPQDVMTYRKSLRIKKREIAAVFASEPLFQEQGEPGFLGYTERSSLQLLVLGIQEMCNLFDASAAVIIRQHPREKANNYDAIIPQLETKKIRFVFENQSNPQLAMLSADVVCGMSSMFLLEAALLGKAVISVMPNLTGTSPFVLDRLGTIKSITNELDLSFEIDRLFLHPRDERSLFRPLENAAENIVKVLNKTIR